MSWYNIFKRSFSGTFFNPQVQVLQSGDIRGLNTSRNLILPFIDRISSAIASIPIECEDFSYDRMLNLSPDGGITTSYNFFKQVVYFMFVRGNALHILIKRIVLYSCYQIKVYN